MKCNVVLDTEQINSEPSPEEEVDPLLEVNDDFQNSLAAEQKKLIPLCDSILP